jgi:PAS domain S-box-containing protein
MLNRDAAGLIVDSAVDAIQRDPLTFHTALDEIPAAIYVTDIEGTITYFNAACIDLAGRTPELGRDKWCVTWRIYTPEGDFVPHDQCPMATAIREKRPVRDVEAVAERPDGGRVHFIPFPTPLFDAAGEFSGAVNLLLDVTEQRKPEYLRTQAARCRQLAAACTAVDLAETLQLMAAKYDEQSLKLARSESDQRVAELPH